MLTFALSSTWRSTRRLVAIAVAVIAGVAFLAATLVVGDSASAAFRVAFDTANAGTDNYVRSTQQFTGGRAAVRRPIDAGLLGLVAGVPGVAEVAPVIDGPARSSAKTASPSVARDRPWPRTGSTTPS